MGQVGWGQWQLQVQPKVLKTPGPDGGYQQTPLRDSPKPRPCHREPAGAPGLCPRAVRKGSGARPPGGLGAVSGTGSEGPAPGGHQGQRGQCQGLNSFLAGWPPPGLAQGLRAHLGAGGGGRSQGQGRAEEVKGERVGAGGIGKVQVGGAGTGDRVADSQRSPLTHAGRSLAPGSLSGQGAAEDLRLPWPGHSLPAQLECPHFSDKQTCR